MLNTKTLLLGLGAQKTGTTWFANYLKTHPEVYVSSIKEMHFFKYFAPNKSWPNRFFENQLASASPTNAYDLIERLGFNDNIAAYKSYFQNRISHEEFFCEITPAYSFLPVSELERIYNNFDNIKPFLFIRNPADRFWSHLKFTKKFENENQFLDSINICLKDIAFERRSDYEITIKNVNQVFKEDTLHIEFYENLFTDVAINRFCNFSNITFHQPNYFNKKNVSNNTPLPEEARKRIVLHYKNQYLFCYKYFNKQLPESWLIDIENHLV
jgi:hypothetical protein